MNTQAAITALHEKGYSIRKIARELGAHRRTVRRYIEASLEEVPSPEPPGLEAVSGAVAATGGSKCTIPTTGSLPASGTEIAPRESKCTIATAGFESVLGAVAGPDPGESSSPSSGSERKNDAISAPGRQSHCEPFRELIESKLDDGLHAQRIWQDLVDDHAFKHSYESVKRFVVKLKQADPKRVWRMECEPGEEVQIDYGTMQVELGGKRKKIHLLRLTLSHSRKGYTEAMPRQDTESFIRGIENALRHFGGVPRLLVLDNLKAGVIKPCYYDPELNPKFATFCKHYGIVAMPTLPRTPQHKGKIERGVGYVKESAVRGKKFTSLQDLNIHLRHWEKTIADMRIHGTTRKQVAGHFRQSEMASLQPLPPDLFPSFVEAKRKVHRDSYIEYKKAFYDVPPEYISRELWVRSDGRMVRLFNLQMEPVIVHAKLEPGQFSKVLGCGGTPKSVRDSLLRWEQRAAEVGDDVGLWANGLVLKRKEAGLRPLMGLINQLLPRYGSTALNRACGQARLHGQYRLREVKNWLDEPAEQQAFSFLSDHELIRSMDAYGNLVGFEESN